MVASNLHNNINVVFGPFIFLSLFFLTHFFNFVSISILFIPIIFYNNSDLLLLFYIVMKYTVKIKNL